MEAEPPCSPQCGPLVTALPDAGQVMPSWEISGISLRATRASPALPRPAKTSPCHHLYFMGGGGVQVKGPARFRHVYFLAFHWWGREQDLAHSSSWHCAGAWLLAHGRGGSHRAPPCASLHKSPEALPQPPVSPEGIKLSAAGSGGGAELSPAVFSHPSTDCRRS